MTLRERRHGPGGPPGHAPTPSSPRPKTVISDPYKGAVCCPAGEAETRKLGTSLRTSVSPPTPFTQLSHRIESESFTMAANNYRTLLMTFGAALALSACGNGADRVASPGEGAFPPPPATAPPPAGPTGGHAMHTTREEGR